MTAQKLKTYVTESVMAREGESPVYGGDRIIIRVADASGGPFLVVRGDAVNLGEDYNENDIFFYTEKEIDAFAATCKNMLRQVEEAENSAPVAAVK